MLLIGIGEALELYARSRVHSGAKRCWTRFRHASNHHIRQMMTVRILVACRNEILLARVPDSPERITSEYAVIQNLEAS